MIVEKFVTGIRAIFNSLAYAGLVEGIKRQVAAQGRYRVERRCRIRRGWARHP